PADPGEAARFRKERTDLADPVGAVLQPLGAHEAQGEALDVPLIESVIEGDMALTVARVEVPDGAAEEARGTAPEMAEGGGGHGVADLERGEAARRAADLAVEAHGVAGIMGDQAAIGGEGLADAEGAVG